MRQFQYTVSVTADTRAQADQVIDERIHHDEDYGFDYTIVAASKDRTSTHHRKEEEE